MTNHHSIIAIAVLLMSLLSATSTPVATPSTAFVCPVTIPDNARPTTGQDPYSATETTVSANNIFVNIPADGVLVLPENDEIIMEPLLGWRAGEFTWLRGEGVWGKVIVSGTRLDEPSELSPRTPLSPTRQYTNEGYVKTGIAFPSPGCWEVVGSVGEDAITWVMQVEFQNEAATPIATP